jgi:hypothetical protein
MVRIPPRPPHLRILCDPIHEIWRLVVGIHVVVGIRFFFFFFFDVFALAGFCAVVFGVCSYLARLAGLSSAKTRSG